MTLSLAVLSVVLCPVAWSQTGAVAEAEQGLRLAKEGKYDLAAARYKSALSKNPRLPGVYLNLGLALFKLDRLAEAVPAFEKALKADPASFQTRVLLGMSYYGTRKFLEAAATLKPAVAQQPDVELRAAHFRPVRQRQPRHHLRLGQRRSAGSDHRRRQDPQP